MSAALVEAGREQSMEVLERVVVAGDLGKLSAADRVSYYRAVCQSTGLNPLTKPFDYIQLNGRLTLYATRTATDQLRSLKAIAIDGCERDLSDPDFATWLVTGHDSSGRVDTEIGSVAIAGLKGEAKANAIMKALTKAKRRLTLSLAGLGWLDETEIGAVPSASPVSVDTETGEILAAASAERARPVALADRVADRRAAIEARSDAAVAPATAPSGSPSGGTAPEEDAGAPPPAAGEEPTVVPSDASPSPDAVCGALPAADSPMGLKEACTLRLDGHGRVHKSSEGSWPR